MRSLVITMLFVASAALASTPAAHVGSEAATILLPEVKLLVGQMAGSKIWLSGHGSTFIRSHEIKNVSGSRYTKQMIAAMAGEKFEFDNSDFIEVEVALPERTLVVVPKGLYDWIDKLGEKGTVGAEDLHEQVRDAISLLLNNNYKAFSLGGVVFMTEETLLANRKEERKEESEFVERIRDRLQDLAQ